MELYDTMRREKVEFKPIQTGKVKLYACGLTVYNEPHIGNWSVYIVWDVLVRFLRSEGLTVNHVQNYTDVGHLVNDDDDGEDKMVTAANRERKNAWAVADYYIDRAEAGMKDLNIIRPNHMPRATDYIKQQIAFVEKLQEKGFAYIIPGEGVYFDTSKLTDYGKLARLDLKGLQSGSRVSISGKRNPTDFALWKFSPKNEKRDMEWDAPFDEDYPKGFPGWHLECSTMIQEILGDTIDIHTGGIDHIPVHHTNEIAQTEALTSKQFVNYWLHRNFIKVDGQKMSKSLNNFYTLDDLKNKGFSPFDFRILMLQSHYRTESNFSWDNLAAAHQRRLDIQAFADLRFQSLDNTNQISPDYFSKLTQTLRQALADDLNTPMALSLLSQAMDDIQFINTQQKIEFEKFLIQLDDWLGLNLTASKDITADQKELIANRQSARDSKDFAKSDQIRDTLISQNLELKDTSDGSFWSRAN